VRSRTFPIPQPDEVLGARALALTRLCLADTCRHYEQAAGQLLKTFLHFDGCFFIFAPAGATTPAYFPDEKVVGTSRRRFREGLREDYWYRRHSPKVDRNGVVRHSDHTPLAQLKRTTFYRDCLNPLDYHYGASLVFWEKGLFLGCLTLLRNSHRGDFTDSEIHILRSLRRKPFTKAINRLAGHYRVLDELHALREAVYLCDDTCVVVNRPDRIVAGSKQALRMLQSWNGNGSLTHNLPRTRISLPVQLREWCEKLSAASLPHPKWTVRLAALSSPDRRKKGSHFLLRLSRPSSTSLSPHGWPQLNHTERNLICGVVRGLTNREIAATRNTSFYTVKNQMSHLLKKLQVRNRVALAAQFRDVVLSK
jgi:DNA-binding CsgD family transcriptional regulator